MVLDASVIDWRSVRDVSSGSGVRIGWLLDGIEHYPTAESLFTNRVGLRYG
jgi:hypothetical protein